MPYIANIGGTDMQIGLSWQMLRADELDGDTSHAKLFRKAMGAESGRVGVWLESTDKAVALYATVSKKSAKQCPVVGAAWLAKSTQMNDQAIAYIAAVDVGDDEDRVWLTVVKGGVVLQGIDRVTSIDDAIDEVRGLQGLFGADDLRIIGPESLLAERIDGVHHTRWSDVVADHKPYTLVDGNLPPVQAILFALVILAVMAGVGYVVWDRYFKPPPPPPITGPALSDMEVNEYNDTAKKWTISRSLAAAYKTTSVTTLANSCAEMWALARPLGKWNFVDFQCDPKKRSWRYTRNKSGNLEGFQRALSQYMTVGDNAIQLNDTGTSLTLVLAADLPPRDSTIKSVNELPTQHDMIIGPIGRIQALERSNNVRIQMGKPRPVTISYQGKNQDDKIVGLNAANVYQEGTLIVKGASKARLRNITQKLDDANVRGKSLKGRGNAKKITWTLEVIYVVNH